MREGCVRFFQNACKGRPKREGGLKGPVSRNGIPESSPDGDPRRDPLHGRKVVEANRKIAFAVPSHFYGSLAQLVQSVCLTSRGSGVRIPQLPQRCQPLTAMQAAFFLTTREHSSVGLERLLDKQEVSGSNPLVPTIFERPARLRVVFCTRLRIPVSPCVRPKDPRKRTVEKWNWDLQMSLICAIFAPANPNSGA